MTVTIQIDVPGEPVPKGRPRMGRGRAYTPDRTRRAEEAVVWSWIAEGRPTLPADCYYEVEATFTYALPARPRHPYPGRSDLDNLAKLVVDALVTAGAIPDDRRMVALSCRKGYGSRSRTQIVVRAHRGEEINAASPESARG